MPPGPEDIADDGRDADQCEQNEQKIRELLTVDLGLRFFRDDVIGPAHEAEEEPDNQKVDVDRARGVERQDTHKRIKIPHVLRAQTFLLRPV